MSKEFEAMDNDARGDLLDRALDKAEEVMGRTPCVLIGCSLGPDRLINGLRLATTTLNQTQVLDLFRKLAANTADDDPLRDKKIRTVAKIDQMWADMPRHLPNLVRMATEYPTETPADRLVRDCIVLVVNEVNERVKAARESSSDQ